MINTPRAIIDDANQSLLQVHCIVQRFISALEREGTPGGTLFHIQLLVPRTVIVEPVIGEGNVAVSAQFFLDD